MSSGNTDVDIEWNIFLIKIGKKQAEKKKKKASDDEAFEESDDGDEEGREMDCNVNFFFNLSQC